MTDVAETLSALGFRATSEQIHALLAHLTQSRASPMQTVEQLAELERREREVRNLASRTKKASLGTTKPSADFEWSYPKRADQAIYEELATLGFVRKKQNVLFRGPAGTGRPRWPRIWASARSRPECPSSSPTCPPHLPISFGRSLSLRWSAVSVATPPSIC